MIDVIDMRLELNNTTLSVLANTDALLHRPNTMQNHLAKPQKAFELDLDLVNGRSLAIMEQNKASPYI